MEAAKKMVGNVAEKAKNNWKLLSLIAVIIVIVLVFVFYAPKRRSKTTSDSEDSSDDEEFIASGGRSDSHGGDQALRDKIHDINACQQKFIRQSKHSYRYQPEGKNGKVGAPGSAAPAVYSPEEELQRQLYG